MSFFCQNYRKLFEYRSNGHHFHITTTLATHMGTKLPLSATLSYCRRLFWGNNMIIIFSVPFTCSSSGILYTRFSQSVDQPRMATASPPRNSKPKVQVLLSVHQLRHNHSVVVYTVSVYHNRPCTTFHLHTVHSIWI